MISLSLVIAMLGSIFFGSPSPMESAAVGALGAILLARMHNKLSRENLRASMQLTTRLTSMVFLIFAGATACGAVAPVQVRIEHIYRASSPA